MTALMLLAAAIAVVAPSPGRRLQMAASRQRQLNAKWLIPVAVAVTTAAVLMTNRVMVVLAGVLAGTTMVLLFNEAVHRRTRQRHRRDTADLLGRLVADMDAGAQPAHAVMHVHATDPPTDPALAATVRSAATYARRGRSPAAVFADADVPELAQIGHMWQVADHHGIPLAGLLREERDRLTAALRHDSATSATLQGPQATSLILALLPVAGIGLGAAMGAHPLGVLFGGGLGGILLLVGTGLICAGLVMSQRIVAGARA